MGTRSTPESGLQREIGNLRQRDRRETGYGNPVCDYRTQNDSLVLLYAYVGFENSVVPAGEARNPRRDIPWALVKTTVFIGFFSLVTRR
jgi:hypothetical protein